MSFLRLPMLLLVVACAMSLACAALNYPEPPATVAEATEREGVSSSDADEDAQLNRMALAREAADPDEPLMWHDLTRLAREHQLRGEFDEARERLSQAATQVEGLSPGSAARQTVFGLRARLANRIAQTDDFETADAMADELFAEAEATPELGGAALVPLALSVAERRQEAALELGEDQSQLSLLRIALVSAQTGTANRERMNLASRVATVAYRDGDLPLAQNAINQALSDAYHLTPTNKRGLAALQLERAQITKAAGDLESAEASATMANRLLDDAGVGASARGIGEAVLAEILARKGENERAIAVARGAHARIGGDEAIGAHAERRILASLARVEKRIGETESARRHLEQALAIPGLEAETDIDLVKELTDEMEEMNRSATPPESSSTSASASDPSD